jgi:acyl carrier protein
MTIDSAKPRRLIADAICQVAPDIGPSEIQDLDADDFLKDELELDSMDLLNIATEIFERSGINIPERDYVHMQTLGAFENYLTERMASAEP